MWSTGDNEIYELKLNKLASLGVDSVEGSPMLHLVLTQNSNGLEHYFEPSFRVAKTLLQALLYVYVKEVRKRHLQVRKTAKNLPEKPSACC